MTGYWLTDEYIADEAASEAAAEARYCARYEAKVAIAEESGCEVSDVSDDEADELLSEWAAQDETEASLMLGRV
jgi:hypothetical protein